VFERFVRAGGDGGGGSGLGLAIVQAVADSHGGTVTMTPANPGGVRPGARFEIRLPLARSAAEAPVLEPQTSTTTGSTIGRRLRRS
jgi:signal transduction histidine kinase